MSASLLGFIRGLGTVLLLGALTYVGDASHLNGVLSVGIAAFVSSAALALEHAIEANTGNALFGAVSTR